MKPQDLHAAIATGIDRALRDLGTDLTGCTPSMLTGHVINELRSAGLHPDQWKQRFGDLQAEHVKAGESWDRNRNSLTKLATGLAEERNDAWRRAYKVESSGDTACSCESSPGSYEGPSAECPIHGAVRALNQVLAEQDLFRWLQAEAAWQRDQALTMLADAGDALRDVGKKAIVVEGTLKKPYPDAPDKNPWDQYMKAPARRAYNLGCEIRKFIRDGAA